MPPKSSATTVSRRNFLALSGAGAAVLASRTVTDGLTSFAHAGGLSASRPQAPNRYPIGIELYAVRGELARDLPNTLRTVAQIGYEVVEFYAPYLRWTFPYAKEVRTRLDDLGLRCFST